MSAFIALLLCAAPAPQPQTTYDLTVLTGPAGVGLARVFDINDAGVVAGSAMTPAGERPALWSPETGVQIIPGFTQASVATSVNDRGQVSGSLILEGSSVMAADRAFLWDAGVITTFEPVGTTEVTAGVDITEDGRVLVSSGFQGGGSDRTLIARTLVGTSSGLGPIISGVSPNSVSASGVIGGGGAVFAAGQLLPVGTIMTGDNAVVAAVNDSLVAVGRISRPAGGFSTNLVPVIWDASQQPSVIPVPNFGENSIATDINNLGQIVGRSDNEAFIYEVNGSPVLLAAMTSNVPAGTRLREANEINERGQIIGTIDNGGFASVERVLLVPSDQVGTSFCVPGVNSLARTTTLFAEGSTAVSANALSLVALDARDGFGLFFSSPNQAVPSALGDGFLCLGGPFQRIPPAVVIQDGRGSVDLDLAQLGIAPGDSVSFQFWFRDVSAGGAGFNLSQGLEVTFQ